MLQLTNLESQGRRRWCTAIVLVAICALTVSVATRYGSPVVSDGAVTIVQQHSSFEPALQRLLNNAATWIPPVVAIIAVLHEPASYPHIVSPSPTVSTVLLERKLYNRPPPSIASCS